MSLSKKLKHISASLLFITSSSTFAADLPISPEKLIAPYPEVKVTTLNSAQSLINEFKQHQYQLANVSKTDQIPSFFVENLPSDLNSLPVQEKISGFIRLLLPTIIEVNKRISTVRHDVIALSKQPKSEWSKEETVWLNDLMTSYDIKSNNIDDLLLRLDIIPVGMVLAQGIDESGWGTSYFAVKGNGLYGEHLSSKGGKYLSTPGGHVKVAAFDNLFAGTARYMYNLNTTSAYKDLWTLRQKLSTEGKLSGYELVESLSHYSTRGDAYVENLQSLIKHHKLDSFDQATFDSSTPIRVRFED
ncbi:glucosaminidase domain-containing protein [Aliivibrio sp. S4TY2]|uniref:glucosaminidase domain-containing protein n=1 Tax=unclassified Aliivibrio TaxID=2645654 RepID=UPI0023787F10|nr:MULTISPECIES: glucosaminidase domain-containing protein [unclassified Aliivibrio]MDD9156856.1 glucosaminidase domain-containing protein [Aliivibrio sp. S4TY2]MDD9160930.1 glucosaminidase domain-containing protein [Aliivibrio sp. S4TY1]MDD9164960.1 glucosaminidase domain-containing protein [Aliivibrio sp. S4MY2]MDD9168765.1 glucosaminidase domain-containing protein [Aliivibrio sp. S4MY4]MDD9185294.1 glucosaminidase domain-containing protein [Aliivibrio sp. S4MY3]